MMKIFTADRQKYIRLRWRDVEMLIERLASRVEASYRPTMIVGVQRGGVTVAQLLSDRLGVYNIYFIGCRISRAGGSEREVYQPLPHRRLAEDNVLLIDDVADSGRTLKYLIDRELIPKKPRSLRTATLHVKPWSELTPDFYAESVDGWVIYPWETYESARNLLLKLLREQSQEEAKSMLARVGGIPKYVTERCLKTQARAT